jgi:intracellular septation protein A
MKDALLNLGTDFLSAIVFLTLYLVTGSVVLATCVAIAGAVAQAIYSRIKGKPPGFMAYASLTLTLVLAGTTLLTNDPRFVLAKPSIAHFAIGAIMLRRGWMLRYVPPIVIDTIPEYVTVAGYAWAALMFALGAGTIAVASTGNMKLWTIYVTVVLAGAKLTAFAIQYVTFRILVTQRLLGPGNATFAVQLAAIRIPVTNGLRTATRRLGIGGEIGYTAPRPHLRNLGETEMAVDGNWNIVMSTPMGERNATLSLKNAGGTLTGTQAAEGNSTEIFDGTANGDDVAWKLSITNPMPLTLAFTGKVAGDSISGEMGIGPMGSFPFKGTRA